MNTSDLAILSTVALVVLVSAVSGPLVGAADLTPPTRDPNTLGGGDAQATVVGDPATALAVDGGRFGTGVSYLRVPDATVRVRGVRGQPRLIYRIRVPALGVDRTATRVLGPGDRGRTSVPMAARAFPPGTIENSSYRARVVVRVQSFDVDRTVYDRNVTVQVRVPRR